MSTWSHWKRTELTLLAVPLPRFNNGKRCPSPCSGCQQWKRSLFVHGPWLYCRSCAHHLDRKAGINV